MVHLTTERRVFIAAQLTLTLDVTVVKNNLQSHFHNEIQFQ